MRRIFPLVLLVCFICLCPVHAQENVQRETLKGLRGFAVNITKLSKDAEENGLTSSDLKGDTELALRQSGIKVVSKDDANKDLTVGRLSVEVEIITNEDLCAYTVTLRIYQAVRLHRDPKITTVVATWEEGGFGTVGIENVKDLRGSVQRRVDKLINDYLAVNDTAGKKKSEVNNDVLRTSLGNSLR